MVSYAIMTYHVNHDLFCGAGNLYHVLSHRCCFLIKDQLLSFVTIPRVNVKLSSSEDIVLSDINLFVNDGVL